MTGGGHHVSDAQIWQHWLQWLPTAAPSDLPGPIFGQYHTKLLEAGVSEIEADNRITTILRLMCTETDGSQVFYNDTYTNPSPGFNTKPSALLVSAWRDAPPAALSMSAPVKAAMLYFWQSKGGT